MCEYSTNSTTKSYRNHGKGFAVRCGVELAIGCYVLFMDAEGSIPRAEIDRLREAIDAGNDIAMGSCALKDEKTKVQAL